MSSMWLLSGLLVGLVAVQRGDMVFILLQLSSFTSAALILFLARRYKGMACETHAHLIPTEIQARPGGDVGSSKPPEMTSTPRESASRTRSLLVRIPPGARTKAAVRDSHGGREYWNHRHPGASLLPF
jgi:hypothetical protein